SRTGARDLDADAPGRRLERADEIGESRRRSLRACLFRQDGRCQQREREQPDRASFTNDLHVTPSFSADDTARGRLRMRLADEWQERRTKGDCRPTNGQAKRSMTDRASTPTAVRSFESSRPATSTGPAKKMTGRAKMMTGRAKKIAGRRNAPA